MISQIQLIQFVVHAIFHAHYAIVAHNQAVKVASKTITLKMETLAIYAFIGAKTVQVLQKINASPA